MEEKGKCTYPLVSIIVPVYNCEKYVEKCILSLVNQSYINIEIIIINDGSTDSSAKLINKLVGANDNAFLINQKNKGVSEARNLGVKSSKGKYITFVDGDDYLEEHYIENFVKQAEKYNAQLCVCGYTLVDEAGKILNIVSPTEYTKDSHEEYIYRILAVLSRFYARELWIENNIEFEKNKNIRGEDIPVALLTNAIARNVQCVDQTGYYYVQHQGSARERMRGLSKYRLPYDALEKCIIKVTEKGCNNNFFELGVFRVFSTFLFDLGRGTTKEEMKELIQFQKRIIYTYFIGYRKNKTMYVFTKLQIPMVQKMAVAIYIILFMTNLIKPIAGIIRNL